MSILPEQDKETWKPVEGSVYERYAAAANSVEPALCCPVEYASDYLDVIPQEVIERDYGCGDPSPFVKPGDTVLDLGAGGGKLCFIAAQLVGASGRVIGVDCNQSMLELARWAAPLVANRLGYSNVDFRYGMIQDLRLDLDLLEKRLAAEPVNGAQQYLKLRQLEEQLRSNHPLVADESVDCVVSNCVLNLVRSDDRQQLFREIHRVLKPGGQAAISDIVSDETVPERLKRDPILWSGCLSGAFREDELLEEFERAGFYGIEIARRAEAPWKTIEGIEFRSVTVVARKGKEGPCLERNQAVIYKGPFRKVEDDDGHVYRRGKRMAVCDKTFQLLQRDPYATLFEFIHPREEVPMEEALPFSCRRSRIRSPRETKGTDYKQTDSDSGPCCGPDHQCC